MEQAEQAIADWCDENGVDFAYVSDTGTVENLLSDGWTYTDIITRKADKFIGDNLFEL